MENEQKSGSQKKRKHIFDKKQSKPEAPVTTGVTPAVTPKAPVIEPGALSEANITNVNSININGIKLGAEMARNAIIMSEIIGPPKAKRRRGRCY